MKASQYFKYGFLIFLFLVFSLTFGCAKPSFYSRTESVMGTEVTISVFDLKIDRPEIKAAVDKAFEEVRRIDMLMSNYRENSDVSKINKLKAGEGIKISEETYEVLRRSQEISALSKGAFDITVLPLMELWGFYSNSSIDNGPTPDELAKVLKHIGRKKITLRPNNYVTKNVDGVKIDLGGIAKGYAVDRAIGRLKSCGIKSALVEAGGDLYCLGMKPDKNLWRIAIQHPRKKKKVIAVLEVSDCAVATSGDYENYNIIRGKRYSHIIDPRTGYPKVDVPAGVTIVAKDTTTADGLATAIFVLGPEEGMNLVESLPDVEAVIISDKAGSIKSAVSLGLKDKIKFIGD